MCGRGAGVRQQQRCRGSGWQRQAIRYGITSDDSDSDSSSESTNSDRSASSSSISIESRSSIISSRRSSHSSSDANNSVSAEESASDHARNRNNSSDSANSDSESEAVVNSDTESHVSSLHSENNPNSSGSDIERSGDREEGLFDGAIDPDTDSDRSSVGSFGPYRGRSTFSSPLTGESDGDSTLESLTGSRVQTFIRGNSPFLSPFLDNSSSSAGSARELNFFGFSPPAESERNDVNRYLGSLTFQDRNNPNMAGASAAIPGTSNGRTQSAITFECSVCLESLDAPASINEGNADGIDMVTLSTPSPPLGRGSPIVLGAPIVPAARRGRGVGTARRGGRSPRVSLTAIASSSRNIPSLTDVVATFCGHLYHQVCLEKWFAEQGRRTCPSCRKQVPASKLIRLYPSIAEIPVARAGSSSGATGAGNSGNIEGSGNCNCNGVSQPPRNPNPSPCEECQDLKQLHNTLINDYNELRQLQNDLKENDEVQKAQIISLEEDNQRYMDENSRLKRELEESRTSNGYPTSAKRRRK